MTAAKAVSPTSHPFDPRSWAVTRRDRASWTLTGACAVMCLAAILGGIGLLQDSIGMPVSQLDNTPFDSWTFPAIALFVAVALPQGVAAGLAAAGHRWGAVAGVVVGMGLVAWIAVQLLVFQQYYLFQPIVAGFGFVEIGLAAWWTGREGPA